MQTNGNFVFEEILNSLSHGLAFLASVVGANLLISQVRERKSERKRERERQSEEEEEREKKKKRESETEREEEIQQES